jgi:hypothetical protein
MRNHRTPSELKAALDAIVSELQALDVAAIDDNELVPLAKTVQAAASFVEVIDGRIQARVIADGMSIAGAMRKPIAKHRFWHDETVAADLAFATYGLKAFKLQSPAALEKLGEEGMALVAVASTKPEASYKAAY